ncbi:hypothetical protein [Gracilinema caldarium]|uniref:Uncharacterized protein n=1 Tax=Gracilinema caldarium (strain ATCC 51460 / DSM 7334 / H1) TaxID=744872 RepID=F8EZ74_GRAC1|nr:hypothetical protein [Gracilinema caldarium]AEJ19666.1 hypothetical protein Spica_1522 [Gracilinema caldarium DSM 7334]
MFDPKISGLVAGIAFILSILFGMIAGAAFLIALIRALIFAVFFFVFSGLVYWLITQFIPELIENQGQDISDHEGAIPDVGSKVNISVGEEEVIPENSLASQLVKDTVEEDDEFISEKALDQNDEDSYTSREHDTARIESNEVLSQSPALPIGVIDDVDELPDLEGMSDAFVMPVLERGEDSEHETGAPTTTSTKYAGTSASFDPKEMAMAIQTILKRDQKG